MKLSNYHNEECREIIEPAISGIKKYDWDNLQKIIYSLFNRPKQMDVDLWYTLILMEDKGKLFFGFTQENHKSIEGSIIIYNKKKLKIIRTGRDDGHHGWCKLIIVECSKVK